MHAKEAEAIAAEHASQEAGIDKNNLGGNSTMQVT